MKRFKSVDEFIENADPKWKSLIIKLREILLATKLVESIKWGAPVYTLDGKNVVGIGAFKSYAGLWFYHGALLKDHHKKLVNAQEGKTKAMRQWRFLDLDEVEIDKKLVISYVEEAIENQKNGKTLKPEKYGEISIPDSLIDELTKNVALGQAFKKLTPYRQREYADFINNAKQERTKQKRLIKIIPMILAGHGLNDRYRS